MYFSCLIPLLWIFVNTKGVFNCLKTIYVWCKRRNGYSEACADHWLLGYFPLFIVATSYPSEPRLVVIGDSARIQDEITESLPGSLTCLAYSTVTRDLGLISHPKNNK